MAQIPDTIHRIADHHSPMKNANSATPAARTTRHHELVLHDVTRSWKVDIDFEDNSLLSISATQISDSSGLDRAQITLPIKCLESIDTMSLQKRLSSKMTDTTLLMSISQDNSTIRVMNQLFVLTKQSEVVQLTLKSLPTHIDQVEQRKNFLVVTSRCKRDDDPKKQSKSDDAEDSTGSDPTDTDGSMSGSDADSEEDSAFESWSEASTDVDLQINKWYGDVDKDYTLPTHKQPLQISKGSDDDSSDSDILSNDSEDSNDSMLEAETNRYEVQYSSSEIWGVIDDASSDIWDAPDGVVEDDQNDQEQAGMEEENVVIEIDGVWYHNDKASTDVSDSEGEAATKNDLAGDVDPEADREQSSGVEAKPDSSTSIESASVEVATTPAAQLQVYDMHVSPPRLIFRFKRDIESTLACSPPAIHPTASLIVWPVGDNVVLFADYGYKSYFLRKLRPTLSTREQLSVTPHFSTCGEYLYLVVLEQDQLKTVASRGRTDRKDVQAVTVDGKEQEHVGEHVLTVNAYKMSSRKTSRAPPTLISQATIPLGRLRQSPPTLTWTSSHLFISCSGPELDVYKVSLTSSALETTVMTSRTKMIWPCNPAIEGRNVHFWPVQDHSSRARIVVSPSRGTKAVEPSSSDLKRTVEGDSDYLGKDVWHDGIHIRDVDVETELGGWVAVPGRQGRLDASDGMEREVVPMDTTDDCDCD